MGDVVEETFLSGDEAIKPAGHAVDRAAQCTEFVAPGLGHARVETTVGDGFGGTGKQVEIASESAHKGQPEEDRRRARARRQPEPGSEVEQPQERRKSWHADDEQGEGSAGVVGGHGQPERTRFAGANKDGPAAEWRTLMVVGYLIGPVSRREGGISLRLPAMMRPERFVQATSTV